jgi:hypothetical protein
MCNEKYIGLIPYKSFISVSYPGTGPATLPIKGEDKWTMTKAKQFGLSL